MMILILITGTQSDDKFNVNYRDLEFNTLVTVITITFTIKSCNFLEGVRELKLCVSETSLTNMNVEYATQIS